MRKLFTFIVLGMFSAAIAGCEASAKVDPNKDSTDTSYKKTTTYNNDGSTVKTETKVEKQ
jgi:hypothetical protein